MRHVPRGHHSLVSPAMQATIAVVAFFACSLLVAAALKSFGTAVLAIAVAALLAVALVLQAVTDSPWPAYAALALAVLAAVTGFALEAAVWMGERRRRKR